MCVMKPKMLNLQRHFFVRAGSLLLLLLALRLGLTTARADAVSDLASFSIFDKVDLAQLAKSDVKTAHGSPMSNPRFLAVQSCYVALGSSPAQQIEALRRWDATRHRELKVFLHSDLPSNPTPANFEKLKSAPGNASVRSFVAATQKLAPSLQISKEEAKKFSAGAGGGGGAMPAPVVAFWTDILTARTKSFVSSGMSGQPPYDHAGPSVRASDEVNGLLREQGKIRNQFSGLLGATGIGRGAGSLKPELYWELLDVDDQGVVTLGASYSRGGAGGTLSSCGCSLLCERWLLCCAHVVSDVAGYSGRETFNPGLARRHDLRRFAELSAWRGTACVGVGDDEKHHQSCHTLSARYEWRSLTSEAL